MFYPDAVVVVRRGRERDRGRDRERDRLSFEQLLSCALSPMVQRLQPRRGPPYLSFHVSSSTRILVVNSLPSAESLTL